MKAHEVSQMALQRNIIRRPQMKYSTQTHTQTCKHATEKINIFEGKEALQRNCTAVAHKQTHTYKHATEKINILQERNPQPASSIH